VALAVIPAEAGISLLLGLGKKKRDSRFRGNDGAFRWNDGLARFSLLALLA
jgi:hypothetical protein